MATCNEIICRIVGVVMICLLTSSDFDYKESIEDKKDVANMMTAVLHQGLSALQDSHLALAQKPTASTLPAFYIQNVMRMTEVQGIDAAM